MEKVVSSPSKSIELGRVQHVAAFSDGDVGGNGAGVYLSDEMPAEDDMGALAADLGYSETAFVVPSGEAFRVRYFSPESEVPFCGHATIALGAVLAAERGAGTFSLELNDATISVEASTEDGISVIALQSPPTHSEPARSELARGDMGWPHAGDISIIQGEDMGQRSLLRAEFSDDPGSSIRVSGTTRTIR